MQKRVTILKQETAFKKAIFELEETTFKHERYDGEMSEDLTRLVLKRGDAVGVIVHNPTKRTLLFTEQFRIATYSVDGKRGDGWIMEIPAGMIEDGEDPKDAAKREIEEEIGYKVEHLRYISTFYLSPGGSSERIVLFYSRVSDSSLIGDGGGVASEGENIRCVELPVAKALQMARNGELTDAKTIIGIQWLQLNGLT